MSQTQNQTHKTISTRAKRYAASLIELAEAEKSSKILTAVEGDMTDLLAMIGSSDDFKTLLKSPLIGKTDQSKAIEAIGKKAKLQDMTMKFLGVLINNGRLNDLETVIYAFQEEIARRRGEIQVSVQTAQALSAKQTKALQDAISKSVGANVKLEASVDPDVLGGMVVTLGSHRIDDSVARKLERLRLQMAKQSNENETSTLKEVG